VRVYVLCVCSTLWGILPYLLILVRVYSLVSRTMLSKVAVLLLQFLAKKFRRDVFHSVRVASHTHTMVFRFRRDVFHSARDDSHTRTIVRVWAPTRIV